ncbi:hypothetical protein E1301_Tti023086 [Triplophysa tibetana]|uniref:Uncharacterized protein n=1 Tax=Triplophysa tibetana TaxID=1572043 RepID=A0A5A9NEV1_9TELE|nr:hypothetical protein E1301_Tti023086 [Triplophysa tibetana]
MSVNVCFLKKKRFCCQTSSEEKPDMYPVTLQHSLLVAFLLSLKDVMIDSTGLIILSSLLVLLTLMMIGAAVWMRRNKLRRREGNESNTQKKRFCCQTSSEEKPDMYPVTLQHSLLVAFLLSLKDASRITTVSSVRSLETRAVTLTYNTLTPLPDVMIDSTGLIILSSLLVLLTLMLVGAFVWRRRNNLRRHEGNESQSTNPSLPYTVFKNLPAAPSEHQRQKTEESDDKDDVQYRSVHFGKTGHRPARVDDVQYADITVSARSEEQQNYTSY